MAVANQRQQVYAPALAPKAGYSRVVGLTVRIAAAPGQMHTVSGPVGNNVWLLGVRIWKLPRAINTAVVDYVQVFAGSGRIGAAADLGAWENCLPFRDDAEMPVAFWMHDGRDDVEFTMRRYFHGENRRFALLVYRTGGGADIVQAALEISEG